MLAARDRHLAKRLARIVVENDATDPEQLRAALERLQQGRPIHQRRLVLKAFQRALIEELHRNTLTVESTQPLEPETVDQLVTAFSRDRDRPLRVQQVIAPELIAGVRVRMGDSVFEASVANRLEWMTGHIRQMLLHSPQLTDEHDS